MKKIILFTVVTLAALGVVFFIFKPRQTSVGPQNAGASPASIDKPAFPSEKAAQPIYAVSIPAPVFPGAVPVFTTGKTFDTNTKFSEVAKILGFLTEPKTIVGSRGNFSIWNKEASSLTLGGDPLEISYDSGVPLAGQISVPEGSLEQTARSFINKAGINTANISLIKESSDYFAPKGSLLNPQPNQAGATLIQLNFRYLLKDLPLFTRKANSPSLSVRLNGSGQATSLSGVWFSNFNQTASLTTILSYQDAVVRLQNKEGILTSLASGADFNSEDIPQYAVSQSAINDVVLGYYYDQNNGTVSPVYVFRGTGADTNTGSAVSTITLVSALP